MGEEIIMERYKRKFEEAYLFDSNSKIQHAIIDVILELEKFYPKTVATAYDIYSRINKIAGKHPIPIHHYLSDMTKEEALQTTTWVKLFYNSAMFDLLGLHGEEPEVSDFAKKALDNEDILYKFMKLVYDKKPKDINSLKKLISILVE